MVTLSQKEYNLAQKTIKNAAIAWYKSTGLPIDELEAEGQIILLYTLTKYESKDAKSTFNTFFFAVLRNGLRQYYKSWNKDIPNIFIHDLINNKSDSDGIEIEDNIDSWLDLQMSTPPLAYNIINFRETVGSMSESAQGVISVLLSCGTELVERVHKAGNEAKPKHIRGELKRYLRKDLQWGARRVELAFKELKQAVSTGAI